MNSYSLIADCYTVLNKPQPKVTLLKPLIQRCNCDGCGRERKCLYVPEMEEWICSECLDLVCYILSECQYRGLTEDSFSILNSL